jgi:alpha-amylase
VQQPFVLNHDTQSRYERDHEVTAIAPWFIPLAYAFILLRADSDLPCVFYGDLYGIDGEHPLPPSCSGHLPRMILARKLLAYGPMYEYLDDRNCIGFTRTGEPHGRRGNGLAVLLSNSHVPSRKEMDVGQQHVGEIWTDMLGSPSRVTIDTHGRGVFSCGPRSVSIWTKVDSPERRQIDDSSL